METENQRDIRRAISAWLTEQINTCGATNTLATLQGILSDGVATAIRGLVITSLGNLDTRFKALNNMMIDKYAVRPEKNLVKFYMKGGNAFQCVRNQGGVGAQELGGGNSDWDTQVVIDPWAPQPLIDLLYGLVEDIVLDEFSSLGIAIADVIATYVAQQQHNPQLSFATSLINGWNNANTQIDNKNFSRYAITLDQPQTIRRIYDHDQLGLWMNDRSPLKNRENSNANCIPGQTYNDAINPFVIYRLGYTWHTQTVEGSSLNVNLLPTYDGDINKALLMELIDVTIPRISTIECVTVWEELAQVDIELGRVSVIVNNFNQNVPNAATRITANLPLPSLDYHISEQLTMLCEVADSSSKHSDKMIKRFQRLKIIWDMDERYQAAILKKINAMISVLDIKTLEVLPQEAINTLINAIINVEERKNFGLDGGQLIEVYRNVRNMMYYVAQISKEKTHLFTDAGDMTQQTLSSMALNRERVRQLINDLVQRQVLPAEYPACYSDDLALLDQLLENDYLTIANVGFSGIYQSVTVRVDSYDQLKLCAAKIASLLTLKNQKCLVKMYNTARATRISQEASLIVTVNDEAKYFIALTTATEGEMPCLRDPVNGKSFYCPLSEIGHQRKVAAALIHDYVIRTAIARQYDAIQEVISIRH